MIYLDPSAAPGLEGPAILYRDELTRGTVTWTNETVGGEALNALDTFTVDYWVPSSLPARLFSAGAVRQIDSIGIAAHDMGTKGCSVRVLKEAGATRTNKHLQSENFATGWALSSATNSALVPAAAASPMGSVTAGLLKCTTTTSVSRRAYAATNITVTPATPHFVQMYVKASNWTWFGIGFAAGTAFTEVAVQAQINLTTGQVVSQNGTVTATKLQNGWWKIAGIGSTGPSTAYRLSAALVSGPGSTASVAVGVVDAGVFISAAHVEQTATVGSYIASGAVAGTSSFTALSEYIIPDSDAPVMVVFGQAGAANIAVEINGPVPPAIGVMFVGQALHLDCGVAPSYTPLYLSREIDMFTSETMTGNFMGNVVLRRGAKGSIAVTPMLAAYVQSDVAAFNRAYDDAEPFFFAASPVLFPLDVGYCWRSGSSGTLRPTYDDAGLFMTFGLEVEAVVE